MSEAARRIRSERARWAAPGGRHDRVIGITQWLLPVMIGVLSAFVIVWPLFRGSDVSFLLDKNQVEVAKERLKIQAAQYRGQDAKGQPFSLNAGSAIQKSSAQPIVELNALAAQIGLSDGPAQLKADRGRYDMDSEQVKVDGPVAFRSAGGYTLDTADATIDLKSRQLKGTGEVTGTVPQGKFRADRMRADLESRTVTLDGNARLRINPRAPK